MLCLTNFLKTDGAPVSDRVRTRSLQKQVLLRALPLMLLFLMMVTPAQSDIYTWTDENGVKHFSNEPPPDIKKVIQRKEIKHDNDQYKQWSEEHTDQLKKALEASPSQSSSPVQKTDLKRQGQNHQDKVVIYTTPTCGYCKRAKAFFAKHQIAYAEYDITTDLQARQRYQQLRGSGVPLIYIGKNRVVGFNEIQLRRLLNIQ